ncbi:MAG: FkbM family methyltransferase [Nitrososphaera sp.]|uniref:FkbM family methyltransferase n=1 Tax=Nitrososphaera sp. TaxID=1971748 RepID=UPI003D6FC6D5
MCSNSSSDGGNNTGQASASKEIKSWLKGARCGYRLQDKIILFIHITSAIIIVLLLVILFGKKRAAKLLLRNVEWLNWMPVDCVMVRLGNGDKGALLSLPLRVDYTILLSSTWEDVERAFVSTLDLEVKHGVVIDVGANIGIYAVLLARSHPKLEVIAIEASPKIFDRLGTNCRLNNLSNVTLINAAVFNQDNSTVELYERDSMSTILKDFLLDFGISDKKERGKDKGSSITKRKIKTRTLDSIMESMDVDKVALLKLDIEGAEILALEGAAKALSQKKVKNMLIEYHSIQNYDQLLNTLKQYGYAYSIHQRSQLFDDDEAHVNGHVMATLSNSDSLS